MKYRMFGALVEIVLALWATVMGLFDLNIGATGFAVALFILAAFAFVAGVAMVVLNITHALRAARESNPK